MTGPVPDPFAHAGALAAAYADVDWAATPLGPPEQWSPTLLAALDLALQTQFPVTLLWGPELVLLYNEGYVRLIGDKHPRALGATCESIFPEAWDTIGPMLHGVLETGEPTWSEDQLLPLDRSGFLEESYFIFAYSAVRAPDGAVEGVLDISVETSRQVVTARRLAGLARVNERLAGVRHLDDLPTVLLDALAGMPEDVLAAELRTSDGAPTTASVLPAPPEGPLQHLLVVSDPEGAVVWVPVGAERDHGHDRVLVLRLSPMARLDEDYLDLVRLVGFAVRQHLGRLVDQEAERTLSLTLQESMLSAPRHSPLVGVAVRYQPAVEAARVGGDWYDSFELPDGATMVVVGDVTGHDHSAAAAMGQVRSLLRATAFLGTGGPASVLSTLERAMHGLGVHTLATVVVACLRPAAGGAVRMTWSNAGHLPPVLVEPDGTSRLLETQPELIVGMELGAARDDHEVLLRPGSSLLLYTDGLVERRTEHLDAGIDRLLEQVAGTSELSSDDLCDRALMLLGDGRHGEDDVALLVVDVPSRGTAGVRSRSGDRALTWPRAVAAPPPR